MVKRERTYVSLLTIPRVPCDLGMEKDGIKKKEASMSRLENKLPKLNRYS